MSVNPSRSRLLLKLFGGTALLIAILFAIGELGSFGH